MRPRSALLAILTPTILACAGLIGSPDRDLQEAAARDAGDEAEQARRLGDFAGAEAILERRLAADPNDARSWRLLGDVNLTRGQRFQERWKENLGWAIDAYEKAVALAPDRCLPWSRLAAAAVGAAENEATRLDRARLDALPLARGWTHCAGPALLALELQRAPTPAELAAVTALPADASATDRQVAAAPWMAEAVRRIDLAAIEWAPLQPPLQPSKGSPFAVLQIPTTGASVEKSKARRFTYPEWIVVSRVRGDRLVYRDRRFAAQVPERALTRAPGCPGTKWTLAGADRVPVGTCTSGPHDRRASDLYDPKVLKPTGIAHFHEPSIDRARISWSTVADKPVRCLGGDVGRQFYDTPSCPVAYDRAVPVTRSIPAASGRVAESEAHAEQIVRAARASALFGSDLAAHLARGEVGAGLPYPLYVWASPT